MHNYFKLAVDKYFELCIDEHVCSVLSCVILTCELTRPAADVYCCFQSAKYDMATEMLKRCLQYNKVRSKFIS